MDGLSKVVVTHNGRDYGLVEFCVSNAETALEDATKLLGEFEQLNGNKKLFDKLKDLVKYKGKQLRWVLQEQDIQGCIRRVETAMVGLSIAIHAASLAGTSTACVLTIPTSLPNANHREKLTRLVILSYNENKKALDDLAKQLAENFEKLEKFHKESLDKQERRAVCLAVTTPSVPEEHTMQSQIVQASAPEPSSHLAVAHDQSQIVALQDLKQDPMAGAASRDHHAAEMGLDIVSHMSPSPDMGSELPSLADQANNIQIMFEDGSIALIPAETDDADDDEGVKTPMALVKTTGELPLIRIPQDAIIPLTDAEELVEFLTKDAAADEPPVGTASARPVKMASFFRLEFASNHSEDDADGAKPDPSIVRFLCIERLSPLHEFFKPRIVVRRPCREFSQCDHSTVELAGGVPANELENWTSEQSY